MQAVAELGAAAADHLPRDNRRTRAHDRRRSPRRSLSCFARAAAGGCWRVGDAPSITLYFTSPAGQAGVKFGWANLRCQRVSVMTDEVPEELAAILNEVERAIEAKLYYLAIAVALSLPDICSCLECDPSKPIWATSEKYITWCKTNLSGQFRNLDGTDLFRIRGGILHQGHFDHPKSKFDRIVFLGPESAFKAHDVIATIAPGITFSGVTVEELRIVGDVLQLDVLRFCRSIMDGARRWSVAKKSDPFVQENLPNLVRYRPNGLPPFSVGVPTVA